MISVNATLFIQIIHFLLLVFILNRLMFRPIMKLIDERDKHIEDSKKQMANIEIETNELVDRCVSMEKDARKDAGEESSKLKKEAVAMAERVFTDTREEINAIKEKVSQEVNEKIKTAKQSLQNEAVVLADTITEKVVGRRIDN